jgi:hypothetical protein
MTRNADLQLGLDARSTQLRRGLRLQLRLGFGLRLRLGFGLRLRLRLGLGLRLRLRLGNRGRRAGVIAQHDGWSLRLWLH